MGGCMSDGSYAKEMMCYDSKYIMKIDSSNF